MAECKYFHGEEEINKYGGFRARQFSDASTAVPSSPPLSPPMSRMVSPRNMGMVMEEFGDRLDFEFTGLPDEVSDNFEFHGLPDEISNAVLPTVTIAQSAAIPRKSSTHSSTGCMIFLPTLLGLILYVLLNSKVFRISMGVVAALMLLPGLYLYVVDGCRPEDFDEEVATTQRKGGAVTLALASLSLASFYCAYISVFFRFFMWTAASLMFLPGLYLYAIDGCRPEDYEEGVGGSFIGTLVLSLLGAGSCYGMYVSLIFRACMGTVAALMLLPGLYLYIIDGCRPEDYDEEGSDSWSSVGALVLTLAGLGLYISMVFRIFMGAVAALMLLPGIYLYLVDGCRPEDYEEESSGGRNIGAFLLPVMSLLVMYGMYISTVFRFCMGTFAALMLLPGTYLYVAEGCRPEDCEDAETDISTNAGVAGMVALAALILGCVYGLHTSMVFPVFMATVLALMLIPGLYLYIVDGCRPEDYAEESSDSLQNGAAFALALAGLFWIYGMYTSMFFRSFMGALTAIMFIPGVYLYFVDGCRPEDYEEERSGKNVGALASSLVVLGSCYTMYFSTAFRILMATVIALMIFPGLYLHFVDGCRPEDYEEETEESLNLNGAVLTLSVLGLSSFYGMYISLAFRVFMGVAAAVTFLPGLYLYVVHGCRPEDITEEFGLKED